ncbi:cysteine sulfinic acid decarboxylase [Nephila pilipes]|uniref:Cysteine sulfinic acid decarboxylase n=1 Tax=Nephila pilipes TaxID=299642 RepID=A0A8X6NNX7_NEPPI|nr:cysteine sulfinic acid decarboxylase [Nephila pilipes]
MGNISGHVEDQNMEGLPLLRDVTRMILDSDIIEDPKIVVAKHKVTEFRHPKELEKIFDLRVEDEPATHEEMVKFCQDVLKYSVKTCHPMFVSRLYQGVDGYGLAGAWLTEALNTNQTTYEVAPVFVLLEKALLDAMIQLVGWEDGEGIFCPGGSMANMYGMSLGRFHVNPAVKTKGIRDLPPLTCFISEEAHYSVKKGALFLGLGTDSVILVPTDSQGRMLPDELEKAVLKSKSEGKVPFFVCATSGTTVLGAYDPLKPLSDICKRHNMWLHVDGAWGGATIFSRTHRKLLDGVDRVDSITIDLHKMSGVPFQCTVFLTRHKGILYKCNALHAEYLFQPDTYYDTHYDLGDESIQCSRKVDCLKLWIAWKARGSLGLEKQVDTAFAMAKYLAEKVRTTEGFIPVLSEFECTNICFWYVPPSLRGKEKEPDFWDKIAKVAPAIKGLAVKDGTMLISYQPLKSRNWVNFFRVIVHCIPTLTEEHMDNIISLVQKYGEKL